jgi:very-short-patch-repair endonuclease/predicted transcriptional regulator of viral defense system
MGHERNKRPRISGKRSLRGRERAIAALAEAQHGVVTRVQLRTLGLTRHEIDDRLAAGRLHPLYRGVFAVGHRLVSQRGRWLAAVLAAGKGAVLSHESAAALWELRASKGRWIDVIVPRKRRAPAGVRIHRTALEPSELTARGPIAVTTPLRTLLDLSTQLTAPQLEQAIRQAEYRDLATAASLTSCLSSRHGRRGSRTLKEALRLANAGKGRTRSDLEIAFQAFLRKHDLPSPDHNVDLMLDGQPIQADCFWPDRGLIVELDGGAAHMTTHAFYADRIRDRKAHAAGLTVVRVTWLDLEHDPAGLAADLAAFLIAPPR